MDGGNSIKESVDDGGFAFSNTLTHKGHIVPIHLIIKYVFF